MEAENLPADNSNYFIWMVISVSGATIAVFGLGIFLLFKFQIKTSNQLLPPPPAPPINIELNNIPSHPNSFYIPSPDSLLSSGQSYNTAFLDHSTPIIS